LNSVYIAMTAELPTTATTTTAAAADTDTGDCACPICLESLTHSEKTIYPLPCLNCDFNFCSNCVESFCEAACDDYQVASDGSRQVKVTVACPQCRSKYPVELEETVLLLRSAHALASAILTRVEVETKGDGRVEQHEGDGDSDSDETKEGASTKPEGSSSLTTTTTTTGATQTQTPTPRYAYKLVCDSDLSASQLARKSEFSTHNVRAQLEEAYLLYERAVAKGKRKRKGRSGFGEQHGSNNNTDEEAFAKRLRDEARDLWTALLDQLPVTSCRCEDDKPRCDGSCGSRNSIEVVLQSSGSFSPTSKRSVVDETLFQGFDEMMNRDEKIFLTDLFTGGDVKAVSQAALIMNGVRRLDLSPPKQPGNNNHTISRSTRSTTGDNTTNQNPPMTKQQLQKHLDHIEQTKLQFPLTNHMPGYFLIPAYSYREGFMTLRDKQWDGAMAPPQRSKRVFGLVYGKNYTPPGPPSCYPRMVAVVHAVRGPVGRLGLRKGDVITHVNDAEWNGTAADLQNYIYACHQQQQTQAATQQQQQRGDQEISITVNANPETCEFLRVRREMMIKKAREQKLQQRERAKAGRAVARIRRV